MADLREELNVPLREVTQRVIDAVNVDEKMIAFSDWMLKVVGIDGLAHGMDEINDVIRSEFGPQAEFTDAGFFREVYLGVMRNFAVARNGAVTHANQKLS